MRNPLVSLYKSYSYPRKTIEIFKVLNLIQNGNFRSQVNEVREEYQLRGKEASDRIKSKLPAFTFSGQFYPVRNKESLYTFTGLIGIDIDGISSEKQFECKNLIRLHPQVYCCFVSPTGNGLKVFYETDCDPSDYEDQYYFFKYITENLLGVTVDKLPDICRLCFMSYDSDIYIRHPFGQKDL